MELLQSNESLFDPIRKKWVISEPEERIRQDLIQKMLKELGYPSSLIAVEKELFLLPHLLFESKERIPKRRADIIVFGKGIHPHYALFPLLMIECKALPLTSAFASQVIGYNTVVQAPYLALANKEQILTGTLDDTLGEYHFESGLPTYEFLMAGIKIVGS
ncbi:MAG: type I restriction enzyme HsdR N-terminal domain-containing protein [Chlamydiales bacterium]